MTENNQLKEDTFKKERHKLRLNTLWTFVEFKEPFSPLGCFQFGLGL